MIAACFMEFMDVINSRKSVRDYLGKPVEEEKLLKILEAARLCLHGLTSKAATTLW